MATIQDVGKAILSGKPDKLYIFTGEEYGLKSAYIDKLKVVYSSVSEVESFSAVIKLMQGVHLVPLEPKLYIVRYDADFISSLNADTQAVIDSTRIVGTVVCIYQQAKDESKCMKYLPKYTVRIDPVNSAFVAKYLHNDFPNMDTAVIAEVLKVSTDYNIARILCQSISYLSLEEQRKMTARDIAKAFGREQASTEAAFKLGIASRSFDYVLSVIESYEGDINSLLYAILSTMIELEKLHCQKYPSGDYSKYKNIWPLADIYNMFMQTYATLKSTRKYSADTKDLLIHLVALLRFNPILSVEEMNYES